MPLEERNIEELKSRFGLSYHLPYLYNGEKTVGLAGQRVLEVGGSLQKELVLDELGAEKWWAIEDFDYWTSLPKDGGGTRPKEVPAKLLKEVTTDDLQESHQILLGKIEEMPKVLEGKFTRIFSIACFEHIHRLGLALERMHAALEPGGKLFTMFSPIWSAYEGHHIPDITDANGRHWTKSDAPLPSWSHLLMSPPQMEQYLRNKVDRKSASELVYHIYHNPHINRFMTEDYIRYFQQSPFEIEKIIPSFPVPMDEKIQKQLESRHPGYKHFSNCGIAAILRKAG